MALILHPSSPSSSFATNKPNPLLKPRALPKYTKLSINFQQGDSSAEEATSGSGSSTKKPVSPSPGLGSGSSAAAPTAAPGKKKQLKKNRERASITRREPVEKPSFTTPQDAAQAEELQKIESAFLLAWLGLGAVILLEGIALAASGFLPEAWDNFFVKYLYPSFTPTVFLFVAGTVSYGVLKYLENENSKSRK